MKLSCPSCGAKYSIADEKVQDRLAKIRCRKCSATIIIDGKMEPPNVYTSDGQQGGAGTDTGGAAAPEIGPGEYSVDFGDNDQRTLSIAQIVNAYNTGEVTADTYVWTDGMGDWQPLGEVPAINDALHASAARDSAVGAPAAGFGAAAAVPEVGGFPGAEPEAPRAATRTGSGRGSAHDLFGSIETAGSEEDVTTSAPQPPAAVPAPTATGARNESSVLFSLSALTASAGAPATETSPSLASSTSSSGSDDDSGLIDLKALTSAAGADQPSSPLQVAAAPLGMAAPLGGVTAMPTVTDTLDLQRPTSSKTGLYIGGAIFAGFLVIGGAIAFSGSGGESAAAGVETASPAAAIDTTPTPAEQEPEENAAAEDDKDEVTAKPPATGTAEAEEAAKAEAEQEAAQKAAAAAKPAARSSWKPPSRRTTKSSTSTSSGSSTKSEPSTTSTKSSTSSTGSTTKTTKKKKKKKAKSCNCAPSDLMCAMKCAAG